MSRHTLSLVSLILAIMSVSTFINAVVLYIFLKAYIEDNFKIV